MPYTLGITTQQAIAQANVQTVRTILATLLYTEFLHRQTTPTRASYTVIRNRIKKLIGKDPATTPIGDVGKALYALSADKLVTEASDYLLEATSSLIHFLHQFDNLIHNLPNPSHERFDYAFFQSVSQTGMSPELRDSAIMQTLMIAADVYTTTFIGPDWVTVSKLATDARKIEVGRRLAGKPLLTLKKWYDSVQSLFVEIGKVYQRYANRVLEEDSDTVDQLDTIIKILQLPQDALAAIGDDVAKLTEGVSQVVWRVVKPFALIALVVGGTYVGWKLLKRRQAQTVVVKSEPEAK